MADNEKAGLEMRSAAIVLLALLMPCAQADGLGRLFYTSEQRAQLDREYTRQAPAEERHASVLTLNGIVQRSDGARTVWINGMAQDADDSGELEPAVHAISIPGKSQPIEIKVGQHLLPDQAAKE
jgi:hypothetical protein